METSFSPIISQWALSVAMETRQSAKFQKMLRNQFSRDQMLMKNTTAHSLQWSMPINFQGGDN